jgi:signal transduction histidine kinase
MKLSLWYFAMFATAACLLSIASWWMLRSTVDATENHELKERVEDVQLVLAHEDPNRGMDELRQEFAAIYSIKDDGKWLQVMDQDGNWIFRSKRMVAQNPGLPRPDRLPGQGQVQEFHQDTHFVRVLSYPIDIRGRKYSVQTGLALNRSIVLLTKFGTDLCLLTPAMIILAAVGGHWMSRKALQPVALLAAEARRINDRNLYMRLPVSDANDEISDLSRTLNQMLERIDTAFASVRVFTGNASHELRTPISLLRAEIEVALLRPRGEEEYHATLLRLLEETIRMTHLVENLLALARADGGAETAVMVPISVSALFMRIEETWKTIMQFGMIDFRVEIESSELAVLGDAAGVSRLLSILLENASKYTPPGGSVILSATCKASEVTLSVHDTGIGIPGSDLPKIFDRFYRGTEAGNFGSRGSGLGLALGKWIAERHGTQLNVETEPGRGSRFSFSLMACPIPSTIDKGRGFAKAKDLRPLR